MYILHTALPTRLPSLPRLPCNFSPMYVGKTTQKTASQPAKVSNTVVTKAPPPRPSAVGDRVLAVPAYAVLEPAKKKTLLGLPTRTGWKWVKWVKWVKWTSQPASRDWRVGKTN